MSKPMILVTGARGKTGANVVEQLIERGFPVRAMARHRDDRSERLEKLGAQMVLGDFLDLQSIRSAMKGASRVYFCYPPQGKRLVDATAITAAPSILATSFSLTLNADPAHATANAQSAAAESHSQLRN